ncbi:unnamed protein product [Cunninghamella echinulata]
MNNLPNEILQHIFTYLSQRYRSAAKITCKKWHFIIHSPFFYSSIEIYKEQQLKKFLQLAKNVTLLDKPISYYVQSLYLHEQKISDNFIFDLLTTLENVHYINYVLLRRQSIPKPFPTLKHLTHYLNWYTNANDQWIATLLSSSSSNNNNNNEGIVALEFLVNEQIYHHHSYQQDSKEPVIYLKPIGNIKQQPLHINDMNSPLFEIDHPHQIQQSSPTTPPSIQHQSKVLILPVLNHLTTLDINFFEYGEQDTGTYDIDERTLDSIHTSCPVLASLKLQCFDMNISEEYYQHSLPLSTNTTTIATHDSLKHLNISGILHDVNCYSYLSKKYPHLESFKFYLEWDSHSPNINQHFQKAIYSMITSFNYLKKLDVTITPIGYYDSEAEDPAHSIMTSVWPRVEFLDWLKDHPKQLTHLRYPYDLASIEDFIYLPKEDEDENHGITTQSLSLTTMGNYSNSNYRVNRKPSLSDLLPYRAYLDHLTSLSIDINSSLDTLLNYLLRGNNSHISSYTIKHLKLQYQYDAISEEQLHIYNWLYAFPNLKHLGLFNVKCIYENYTTYQHDSQQQEQGKGEKDDDNDRDDNNNKKQKIDFYKHTSLEKLQIHGSGIYFKHGFTGFSKKCPNLKYLDFFDVVYAIPEWKEVNSTGPKTTTTVLFKKKIELLDKIDDVCNYEPVSIPLVDTCFDVSNLCLNFLHINKIRYVPWYIEYKGPQPVVNRLIVHELGNSQQQQSSFSLDAVESSLFTSYIPSMPATLYIKYLYSDKQLSMFLIAATANSTLNKKGSLNESLGLSFISPKLVYKLNQACPTLLRLSNIKLILPLSLNKNKYKKKNNNNNNNSSNNINYKNLESGWMEQSTTNNIKTLEMNIDNSNIYIVKIEEDIDNDSKKGDTDYQKNDKIFFYQLKKEHYHSLLNDNDNDNYNDNDSEALSIVNLNNHHIISCPGLSFIPFILNIITLPFLTHLHIKVWHSQYPHHYDRYNLAFTKSMSSLFISTSLSSLGLQYHNNNNNSNNTITSSYSLKSLTLILPKYPNITSLKLDQLIWFKSPTTLSIYIASDHQKQFRKVLYNFITQNNHLTHLHLSIKPLCEIQYHVNEQFVRYFDTSLLKIKPSSSFKKRLLNTKKMKKMAFG